MPPRNNAGLTDDQKRAIVAEAHRRLDTGASVTQAATEAGAPYGVSRSTVVRLCAAVGRPLQQPSPQTEAARAAKQAYTAQRQRELVQAMLGVVAGEVQVLTRQKDGERDLVAVGRVSNALGRLAVTDRALLSSQGWRPPRDEDQSDDQGDQGDQEARREAGGGNLSIFEQWRRDVAAIEGRAVDDELDDEEAREH